MNSVILNATARIFFWAMLLVSLFILYRGHNEAGGGFIGGLAAAAAYAVMALAFGADKARAWLLVHPMILLGLGVALAIASGVAPLMGMDGSFLTHLWWIGDVFGGELKLGTTMIFDLGVYLVVVGGVLAILLRMYDTTGTEEGETGQ